MSSKARSLPGCALAAAAAILLQTGNATAQVMVRQDVSTLTAAQIASLRRGVAVMKSRPATDPTSWIYQANIHGTTDTPVRQSWNTCQHGSYLFLPWHRMYLYFFERILRKASGDPTLTLPYWNYSCPCARSLPLIFRSPASEATNSLYVSQRASGINTGAELPVSTVASLVSLISTNFSSPTGSGISFGGQRVSGPQHSGSPHGQIEKQPHDVVHVAVGGVGGWMLDPTTAARDPIFYLHHANIDRLWARWNGLFGGRVNPPDSDEWRHRVFFFFNESGAPVPMTPPQVVNTASQLNYRYDDEIGIITAPLPVIAVAPRAAVAPVERVATSAVAPTPLKRDKVQVTVPMDSGGRAKVDAAAAAAQTAIVLTVEDIDYESSPGVYYEIYLNQPENVDVDPQGPYYVGNLALFALKPLHGEAAPPEGVRQTYDITSVVRGLKELRAWSDENVKVTFFPRGVSSPKTAAERAKADKAAEDAKARFGSVSISTEPIE